MPDLNLAALRQQLRSARRQLPMADRAIAEQAINQQLIRSLRCPQRLNIAAYLPNDGEADIQPALHVAWHMGHAIWLPAIAQTGHHMNFVRYTPNTKLCIEPRFGLLQPINEPLIKIPELQRIWLPLVGFDSNGNRLGMGGGFYDRTLFRWKNQALSPKLIGIGYRVQQCKTLVKRPWDVTMHSIICN